MKTLKLAMLTAAVALAFPAWSFAHLNDLGTFTVTPELGNPAAERDYVSMHYNGGNPLTFLTKEQGGSFSGGGDNPAIPNGGNFFTVTDGPGGTTASVSWNLVGTGFQLNFVLTKDGTDANGGSLYHIYSVSADEVFASGSPQIVSIDGVKMISHITFLGNPGGSVPDSGMTVALLGMSLAGIEVLRRRIALKR